MRSAPLTSDDTLLTTTDEDPVFGTLVETSRLERADSELNAEDGMINRVWRSEPSTITCCQLSTSDDTLLTTTDEDPVFLVSEFPAVDMHAGEVHIDGENMRSAPLTSDDTLLTTTDEDPVFGTLVETSRLERADSELQAEDGMINRVWWSEPSTITCCHLRGVDNTIFLPSDYSSTITGCHLRGVDNTIFLSSDNSQKERSCSSCPLPVVRRQGSPMMTKCLARPASRPLLGLDWPRDQPEAAPAADASTVPL
jgi:hypothetical protein